MRSLHAALCVWQSSYCHFLFVATLPISTQNSSEGETSGRRGGKRRVRCAVAETLARSGGCLDSAALRRVALRVC